MYAWEMKQYIELMLTKIRNEYIWALTFTEKQLIIFPSPVITLKL